MDAHSCWFEVETVVDFERRKTATRHALRQLLRFRLLAEAIRRRSARRGASLAYSGPTISDSGSARRAVLLTARRSMVRAEPGGCEALD